MVALHCAEHGSVKTTGFSANRAAVSFVLGFVYMDYFNVLVVGCIVVLGGFLLLVVVAGCLLLGAVALGRGC